MDLVAAGRSSRRQAWLVVCWHPDLSAYVPPSLQVCRRTCMYAGWHAEASAFASGNTYELSIGQAGWYTSVDEPALAKVEEK